MRPLPLQLLHTAIPASRSRAVDLARWESVGPYFTGTRMPGNSIALEDLTAGGFTPGELGQSQSLLQLRNPVTIGQAWESAT
jgi:hypothetical protein